MTDGARRPARISNHKISCRRFEAEGDRLKIGKFLDYSALHQKDSKAMVRKSLMVNNANGTFTDQVAYTLPGNATRGPRTVAGRLKSTDGSTLGEGSFTVRQPACDAFNRRV